MNLLGLFPVPVGMFQIDRDLTEKEKTFIFSQEKRPNEGNATSTNNYVLRERELASLKKWIEICVEQYVEATVNPKTDVSLRITQSWLNYSTKGQYHHKHSHGNSYISGVFYPHTSPEDKIFFFRESHKTLSIEAKEANIFNSESWWLEAFTGRLILFPSWLQHMVPNVQNDDVRISLSFNTFPVGLLGDNLSLSELKLKA